MSSKKMPAKNAGAKAGTKVGARRHRLVIRDSIGGYCTAPAMKRIVFIGSRLVNGIEGMRMGGDARLELGACSRIFLEELLSKACVLAEHSGRVTINTGDIVEASKLLGKTIYPLTEDLELVKDLDNLKKMALKGKKNPKDITVTSKIGFSRFAREIVQDTRNSFDHMRFTSTALINARIWLEQMLIEVAGRASRLAFTIGKRKTLTGRDISEARKLTCLKN